MKTFVCQVCGYIAFDQAPVDCPVCGMPIENFESNDSAIQRSSGPDNISEEGKKHMPVVYINRDCRLISDNNCVDLNIRIGEIEHVMEPEHYISFIDLYLDKRFVARARLSARRTFPACGFHLKAAEGFLRIVAYCNVHGYWMTRKNLADD